MWSICQCRVCNTADHRCCDWCWFVRTLYGLTCTLRAAHGISQSRISVLTPFMGVQSNWTISHFSTVPFFNFILISLKVFLLSAEQWIFCLAIESSRVYTIGWTQVAHEPAPKKKLDDGWPESEKDVFQAAPRMVVVKNSRWIVGEFYMSYGRVWCAKVRLIKKRILGKGHQMTRVLQPQRKREEREREKERGVERKHGEI